MRFFQRGETADSKFTFLDSETNEPLDINDPKYKISYFNGAIENIVIPETAIPEDQYYMEIQYHYKPNPIRKITVVAKTEQFEIRQCGK